MIRGTVEGIGNINPGDMKIKNDMIVSLKIKVTWRKDWVYSI